MFTFLQKESNLKPFNTQEAEHVGNVRQVVIIQRVRIQVLAKKKKGYRSNRMLQCYKKIVMFLLLVSHTLG